MKCTDIINFGAGPSMLPKPVVAEAAKLFQNSGNGIGVAELSHRSKEYSAIHEACLNHLRNLLSVPDDYEILLVPGGATTQFALLPLNFGGGWAKAAYVITGSWSEKAAEHAEKVSRKIERWDCLKNCPDGMPTTTFTAQHVVNFDQGNEGDVEDYAYLHITSNNTIRGSQYRSFDSVQTPYRLVIDASSDILSRPIDFSKPCVVYAGAQKNLGIAGVAVVILHKDFLIYEEQELLPPMLSYQTHAKKNSLYNTPPTFPITVMKLMLDWVEEQGGLEAMQANADQRAHMLYAALAGKTHYNLIIKNSAFRSRMNVTWNISDDEDGTKTAKFLSDAAEAGLVGLKGHRSVGGMRASMYNGMPMHGAERLAQFVSNWKI